MEKPTTVDGPSTRKMLALAERSAQKNLKVGVGLMCRHCDARKALLEHLGNGLIGEITCMRTYRLVGPAGFTGPKPPEISELLYQIQKYLSFFWASGGLVHDYTSHNIDAGRKASLVQIMGRMASHTGQVVTWDQALNHDHEFASGLDTLTMNSPAPLHVGKDGSYPLPQPGILSNREF